MTLPPVPRLIAALTLGLSSLGLALLTAFLLQGAGSPQREWWHLVLSALTSALVFQTFRGAISLFNTEKPAEEQKEPVEALGEWQDKFYQKGFTAKIPLTLTLACEITQMGVTKTQRILDELEKNSILVKQKAPNGRWIYTFLQENIPHGN